MKSQTQSRLEHLLPAMQPFGDDRRLLSRAPGRAMRREIARNADQNVLLLQGAGIDRLSVRVLKRRGPPLAQPLVLALPPVLSERLRVRGESSSAMAAAAAKQSVAASS